MPKVAGSGCTFCGRDFDRMNSDELAAEVVAFREAVKNDEVHRCPRCGALLHIDWLHNVSSTTLACFNCIPFFCESCDAFSENDVVDHQCKDCRV